MSDYTARKIDSDFKVDGDLGKSIWAGALWSQPFVDMATGEPAEFETKTAIVWSDERLYVAFKAEEPNLQAALTERDSLIFFGERSRALYLWRGLLLRARSQRPQYDL